MSSIYDDAKATVNDRYRNAETPIYRKVTWRLLPFLTLCYVIAYLDRVNVGFAKLQMLNDLQFSETVYGLGAGIFFIFYAIFETPSNLILHKVGARKWIARIMISWGVISASFMFVQTPIQFYILRSLLGIAEAGFFPGIILYLTYWYPAQRRTRVIAIFMAAMPLAGIFGGPLSGWILDSFHNVHGLAGWRWMFLLEAMPAVVLGVVTLFWLDDGIRKAKWLTDQEKEILERNVQAEDRGKIAHASISLLFKDIRVWMMGLVYFCLVMGQYGITLWLPSLVKGAGITGNLQIGLVTAIPYVAAAIAMIFFGFRSDATRKRRRYLIIPLLLGAIGFVASVQFENNTLLAIAALTVASIGAVSAAPLFWPLPTAFLAGASAAGGIGLITSLGNLGGFFSPYMIGWLKDFTQSSHAGMYALTGWLLLGAFVVWRTPSNLVDK
ncbi:MFS transporter [Shinella curvata]|uniref:MFS transporter n=1 Tax=Shinella curvata TaxID=1817964 RepID=A0ABT8XBX1_9HYPH|nr:MFS transporter [Shinella curvata]MCJ8054671.1 MFS transporter [Shinella curvata]MDO6120934.1 MFS transporter [Shinella curvata]